METKWKTFRKYLSNVTVVVSEKRQLNTVNEQPFIQQLTSPDLTSLKTSEENTEPNSTSTKLDLYL